MGRGGWASGGWHAGLAALAVVGGPMLALRPAIGQQALDYGATAPALSQLPSMLPNTPEAVTTEGAEYCVHLQQKIARIEQGARPIAPEAATLSIEGTRMCGHGNTRAGILRLRRALVLMMHPPAALAPDR